LDNNSLRAIFASSEISFERDCPIPIPIAIGPHSVEPPPGGWTKYTRIGFSTDEPTELPDDGACVEVEVGVEVGVFVGKGVIVLVEVAVGVSVSVAVAVGGTGVSVGGTGVFDGRTSVAVGGTGVGSGVWEAQPLNKCISRITNRKKIVFLFNLVIDSLEFIPIF
jgi:hypothetical protein